MISKPKQELSNMRSLKMKEFIDKIDQLCFEYGYEIFPNKKGWTGERDENGELETFTIKGNGEVEHLIYIDGDGCGE